mmetsp:Transcript_13826/g.52616  ORF Transcript_13826/g.52616 Transcript_13826/m.52616 type:complete len:377 (-) Transcript_13826:76-1206(-)
MGHDAGGRADQHVRVAGQRSSLGLVRAGGQRGHGHHVAAKERKSLEDGRGLGGQLPRGNQHEHARRAAASARSRGAVLCAGKNALQRRQGVRSGLSRTGFRPHKQVTALQGKRDGLGLHQSRGHIPHLLNGRNQAPVETCANGSSTTGTLETACSWMPPCSSRWRARARRDCEAKRARRRARSSPSSASVKAALLSRYFAFRTPATAPRTATALAGTASAAMGPKCCAGACRSAGLCCHLATRLPSSKRASGSQAKQFSAANSSHACPSAAWCNAPGTLLHVPVPAIRRAPSPSTNCKRGVARILLPQSSGCCTRAGMESMCSRLACRGLAAWWGRFACVLNQRCSRSVAANAVGNAGGFGATLQLDSVERPWCSS